MKVAFQGETGAYSEEAVFALCPGATPVGCPSFERVFESVVSGDVAHGVVPIENSLHGSVHQNYDHLREYPLVISGEVQVRIRHLLLGVAGATLGNIRTVHSHPQALGQCRIFLKEKLPDAEIFPAYDTAGAAKMIAENADPESAAIASVRAAHEYDLEILAESIESNQNNFTRFLKLSLPGTDGAALVPGTPAESEVGANVEIKTSVVYAQHENVPGSLFKSLAVFALRDIDLLKIESRPLVGSPGKYLFYLDLGGSTEDESVINALRHLEEVAASVKVLGSYPVGHKVE
ncbi:MAG: prephenate dehydratase [Bacteroidetes bacterium]|nr:MAG: prephenate dehydratase [Bacteroidota bacterium]